MFPTSRNEFENYVNYAGSKTLLYMFPNPNQV